MGKSVTMLDGVRVSEFSGWFLIRASGTEPLIRITAEARDASTTGQLLEKAETVVSEAIGQVTE